MFCRRSHATPSAFGSADDGKGRREKRLDIVGSRARVVFAKFDPLLTARREGRKEISRWVARQSLDARTRCRTDRGRHVAAWPALMFVGAGRVNWVEGWLFTGWLVGLYATITLWMYRKDPALLAERHHQALEGSHKIERQDRLLVVHRGSSAA